MSSSIASSLIDNLEIRRQHVDNKSARNRRQHITMLASLIFISRLFLLLFLLAGCCCCCNADDQMRLDGSVDNRWPSSAQHRTRRPLRIRHSSSKRGGGDGDGGGRGHKRRLSAAAAGSWNLTMPMTTPTPTMSPPLPLRETVRCPVHVRLQPTANSDEGNRPEDAQGGKCECTGPIPEYDEIRCTGGGLYDVPDFDLDDRVFTGLYLIRQDIRGLPQAAFGNLKVCCSLLSMSSDRSND